MQVRMISLPKAISSASEALCSTLGFVSTQSDTASGDGLLPPAKVALEAAAVNTHVSVSISQDRPGNRQIPINRSQRSLQLHILRELDMRGAEINAHGWKVSYSARSSEIDHEVLGNVRKGPSFKGRGQNPPRYGACEGSGREKVYSFVLQHSIKNHGKKTEPSKTLHARLRCVENDPGKR